MISISELYQRLEQNEASHRSVLIFVAKGGNVFWGEEVTVHVINPRKEVYVGGVLEQVAGLIREEVAIDNRRQKQVLHTRIWGLKQIQS